MKHVGNIFVILGIAAISSCYTGSNIKNNNLSATQGKPEDSIITMQTRQQILPTPTEGTCNFAISLFRAVCEAEKQKNICISPASAEWALSMVANGANGITEREIIQMLGFKDIETLNSLQDSLISSLPTKSHTTHLSIANSIWINKDVPVKDEFIAINRRYYDATVQSVKFDNHALAQINKWCSEKTEEKIASILDNLDNSTKLLLLNALYLKSSWAAPFNEKATVEHTFTKSNNEEVKVKMMKQKSRTTYFENDTMQIASKHLCGKLEMRFILPRKGIETDSVVRILDEKYETLRSRLKSHEVIMGVPRFKTEYGTSMKQMLKEMGMQAAFGKNAQFEKISEIPLYIDDVIQKSYIAVNEVGVEAAAVTAVTMNMLSMRPAEQPKEMIMDRPFIYLIVHCENNKETILFIGKTEEPKE